MQSSLQDTLVSETSQALCRGRAAVALAADFKPTGPGLSEALHGEAEGFVFDLGFDDPPDHIAL